MIPLWPRKTLICVDDPAAAYIPDRGFHDNPTNDAVTHQIKQWLKKCLVSHPDCGGMTKNHRFLPTRVIDVNRMQLHMSRPDETEPYTALSYCWGGAQVFKTTVKNFQVMVESIQLYSMPQTLQDAVHVTRQIGIRYLWVDCLCIIQDHPIDVALEIDKMHLIYKHSAVTIVAEDPHSVETGFLHPHLSEVNAMGGAIKIPFDCGGGTCGSAYLAPSNNAARVGGLRKRAWAFQETVLSPRLLVYSTQGIVWSCFSEHVNLPNFSRWRSQAPNDLCSQRQKSRAAVKDVNLTSAMLRTDGLRRHLWSGVLTEYQPLEISLAEDRLPALAGIAKHYQEAFGGKYVAGMWEEDLILQLGWQCNGKAVTAPTEASDAAQRPTWSWVSIYGPIKFPNLDTLYEETSQARVISCEVEPRASEAPFGQVKSAILELDAYNLPLFDAACFNRSDVVYDRPDSRPRDLCAQYRCLVLGLRVDPQNTHSTPKILEGLCVNSISDGLYQRIGFVSSPFREFGVWRADRPGRPVSSVCWEDFLRTRARRHHWVIV